MNDLVLMDLFVRGAASCVLVLVALIFLTKTTLSRKSVLVGLLCLSLVPYLIISNPGVSLGDGLVYSLLFAVAGIIPALMYWTSLELFQDDLVIQPWQILLMIVAVGSAWMIPLFSELSIIRGGTVLVLLVHLLKVVISGDADDLIASRRRFRRWFLVCISIVAIIITSIEIVQLDRALPDWAYLLQVTVVMVSATAFLFWSISLRPDIWVKETGSTARDVKTNPAQKKLIQRVEKAMSDGLWRKEGLTVAQVATELGTQEHRLRSAINQGLGHSNFSSYVNGFRIDEAQRLLTDPEKTESTILGIAYDIGFSSIGPFNRAFRARTGMTPTDYRKTHANTE